MKDAVADKRNDWDPSSGVGLTATEAAAARAVASRKPGPLIDDPFAMELVHAVGDDYFVRLADRCSDADDAGFAIPRMVDWVSVRTRFFDDHLGAAAGRGVRQFVILGSGLDTRPYRIDWPPGSVVYEVDRAGVVDFKTATMTRIGAHATAEHRPVAADLAGDWPTDLLARGFDPSSRTSWIAEGLLSYLPGAAQQGLLGAIIDLSATGSGFAADAATDDRVLTARIAAAMQDSARPAGSRVDFGDIGSLAQAEDFGIADHLGKHGWETTSFAASDLFDRYGLASVDAEQIYRQIVFVTAVSR